MEIANFNMLESRVDSDTGHNIVFMYTKKRTDIRTIIVVCQLLKLIYGLLLWYASF